VSEEF